MFKSSHTEKNSVLKLFNYDQKNIYEDFDFIDNLILKENILYYLRYIIFQYSLTLEYTLPPELKTSTFKNITIYAAQIVEAICFYHIGKLLKENSLNKNILGKTWQKDGKQVYLDLEDFGIKKRITTYIEKEVHNTFQNTINFDSMIRICTRVGLPKKVLDILNKFRTKRNKIHVGGIDYCDDLYDDNDMNEVFADMNTIIRTFNSFKYDL